MASEVKLESSGLGVLLFVLFLGLKLTGVIHWSWWWVTAPLWIPVAFIVACFAIGGALIAYAEKK